MRDWRAERVRDVAPSIFAETSALAQAHRAVNLGQGFPDFDGPLEIQVAAQAAIAGGYNQVTQPEGEAGLRQAIAEHAARFYGQRVDPATEIMVTSGASEGIWCSAFAFIEPGDEVIVFEPVFDCYLPNTLMAGGIPIPVTLHAPDFRFDPDELRAAFSPRTRAIFLNTPHNPTGTAFSEEELLLIAALCQEYDVLAIVDEVYEHLVYAGATHRRLAMLPGMAERTVTLSSSGKSFSLTGWKVGWAIAPAPLQEAVRRMHRFTVLASATPMQHAIAAALRLPDGYFRALASEYQAKRDFMMTVLADCGLRPTRPQGSYFIMASMENLPYQDAIDFCHFLIREIGVAFIPCPPFYLDPARGAQWMRVAFCKRWDTLEAAAERLARL